MKDLKQVESRKTGHDSVNCVNIVERSTKLQTKPNRSNESNIHNGHSLGIKYRLGITGLAIPYTETSPLLTEPTEKREKRNINQETGG
jgi:hypothetical protein